MTPRAALKEEPKADVARYDRLLKKLAVAAIAAMPMLMAAVSIGVEAPWNAMNAAQAQGLKLHGMAAAFDEVIDEGIKRSRTPFDVLGRLLAAEDSDATPLDPLPDERGQVPRVSRTRHLRLAESPVNEQQIRTLHDGGFTDETRNIVLVGGPGTAKAISG